MKKIVLMVAAVSVCFASSAFAGSLNPGDSVSCNNANSITLESANTPGADRGTANAAIWKSSNFTTIPISLGPNDDQGFPGAGAAGASKTGVDPRYTAGRGKVVLMKQEAFSRGDSIGDISGEVRITNTGTVGLNVTCG